MPIIREPLVAKTEGEYSVVTLNTYPSYTVELFKNGERLRAVRYNDEQVARAEMMMALRWPKEYARYGASKDWPEEARIAAGFVPHPA